MDNKYLDAIKPSEYEGSLVGRADSVCHWENNITSSKDARDYVASTFPSQVSLLHQCKCARTVRSSLASEADESKGRNVF